MTNPGESGYEQQVWKSLMAFPEAEPTYPFDERVAVFKIRGRMFALYIPGRNAVAEMNLKCDPDQALALRDVFPAIRPGYHMNKKHWNTLTLDGSIPLEEVQRQIEHSFWLVVEGLKKADKVAVRARYGGVAV